MLRRVKSHNEGGEFCVPTSGWKLTHSEAGSFGFPILRIDRGLTLSVAISIA
jgi:hypothetical protein